LAQSLDGLQRAATEHEEGIEAPWSCRLQNFPTVYFLNPGSPHLAYCVEKPAGREFSTFPRERGFNENNESANGILRIRLEISNEPSFSTQSASVSRGIGPGRGIPGGRRQDTKI
jgi:hypothetical protein